MRGSYNYYDNYCDTATERVGVDHLDESMIGRALWKSGHIGVYIGEGWCVEAKGINYGTIKYRVSSTPWQKALKLCDNEYTPVSVTYTQGFLPAANGQRWWYQFADGRLCGQGLVLAPGGHRRHLGLVLI